MIILGISIGFISVAFHAAVKKINTLFVEGILERRPGDKAWVRVTSRIIPTNALIKFQNFKKQIKFKFKKKKKTFQSQFYCCRATGVIFSSIFVGFFTTYVVPECCGGGMLAVKFCLAADTAIPLKVGLYRFFLTAIYIGFGNTLGVEAPTLHICAAVLLNQTNINLILKNKLQNYQ